MNEHEINLKNAFDKVKNNSDWKKPIRATIKIGDREIVAEAIYYYTSTNATFSSVPKNSKFIKVRAPGYRNGPAGDGNGLI